jgi:hypothetical protein
MSIKQFPGGIVTKNPTAPTTAVAKGIWTLDQVSNYVKQGIWPRSPGAPTIGTATVSVLTASVPFTAPTDTGSTAITNYIATSTPSNLTGTGTSPISVTGLAANTSYTFVVQAINNAGTGPASAASNSITTATVPGAPTIGTATATSSSTATVAYTAPASDGGSTITTYTATSSPGGVTGTLSQAGSGTITVSGLTLGITYTFTVTATNAIGTGAASSASNSVTTALVFGQSFEGGYYAGVFTSVFNGTTPEFYLITAPVASGQNLSLRAKTSNTDDPGTTSVWDGKSNSALINDASHPAAQFCEGLTIGGYSDWYLPSRTELIVAYVNLKPTTDANNTSSGNNPYTAPPRSTFTSGSPAQTSAAIFQSGGAEAYSTADIYWTSTQVGTYNPVFGQCRRQGFLNGQTGYDLAKNNLSAVRAVRRVVI